MDKALKEQLEGGKTLKPAPEVAQSYVSDGMFFTVNKLRAKLYPVGEIFISAAIV